MDLKENYLDVKKTKNVEVTLNSERVNKFDVCISSKEIFFFKDVRP
jgi:hypothetical protein